jgi:hypothetical protein
MFVLDPAIRSVDFSVPTYWLGVTSRPELKLRAMAIVSRSAAVIAAATLFSVSNIVRRIELEVRTFPDEGAASQWASGVLQRGR